MPVFYVYLPKNHLSMCSVQPYFHRPCNRNSRKQPVPRLSIVVLPEPVYYAAYNCAASLDRVIVFSEEVCLKSKKKLADSLKVVALLCEVQTRSISQQPKRSSVAAVLRISTSSSQCLESSAIRRWATRSSRVRPCEGQIIASLQNIVADCMYKA